MSDLALAIIVALTGWWFFTGLILWLVHRPIYSAAATFSVATLLMLVALMFVPWVAMNSTVSNTVLGFCLALVLWGWLEMGYLMGFVTGPHQRSCPAGSSLLTRLRLGLGTCLWHELWLLLLVGAVYVLSYRQPNHITLWTFCVLWFMRWSAKLNLVMGVRNYNQNWLPEHLGYLDSYIPRRAMNALFPVSLILGGASAVLTMMEASATPALPAAVALSLVSALIALGTLEHLFLMFPMGDAQLWQWAAPKPLPTGRTGR